MPGVGSIGFNYEDQFSVPHKNFFLLPNLFLFFIGSIQLIKSILKQDLLEKLNLPIFIFNFLSFTIVIYYLKLDWTRYYWPLILPILIINGFGLTKLINLINKK